MIGALIGDIVGSRYERRNHKSKDFELFDNNCRPTDDSVMSLAIAKAILDCDGNFTDLSEKAISKMQELGRNYKNAGYGGRFREWLVSKNPEPYKSYGNGSAMRVGPCGFTANSIDEAKKLSELVTKVTHNHPEGIKGAEAIAVAVYLARTGKNKEEIKKYISENYYVFDFSIEQIRPKYSFDVSCQGSVPIAFEAFFESTDFEDTIRTAISVGGDSDTIASMAGVLAEAYYGVPEDIIDDTIEYLDSCEMEILYYFEKKYISKATNSEGESIGSIFEVIDDAVDKIIPAGTNIDIEGEGADFIYASINEDNLQPDFSSFDKKTEKDIKKEKEARQKKKSSKRKKLDDILKASITQYNDSYTILSDYGQKLFNQRERSIDLLNFIEQLINSIANHPKDFDDEICEIKVEKQEFQDACDFAKKELEAARKSAFGVGSGIAGGAAVVSLAPTAAMWIATTFGYASTGTAISALSGAAATNAALAWLGGGALAAGGGGMAAGNALLALAGPVGWGIAGVSVLSSIILFANKRIKLDKEKKSEIKAVRNNTKLIKENSAKLEALLEKTVITREKLNEQFMSCMKYYEKNYIELSEEDKIHLATIVNNAKSLSALLKEVL